MSGSGKVIGVALVLVGTALGTGIGWVTRGFKDKEDKQKLKDVAERQTHELEAVLSAFELESARMEKIVAAISAENPSSAPEMVALLKKHGLNSIQIEKIVRTRFPNAQQSGAA